MGRQEREKKQQDLEGRWRRKIGAQFGLADELCRDNVVQTTATIKTVLRDATHSNSSK